MEGDKNLDSSNLSIPSPIIHRRNRTVSQSEQALTLPICKGKIESFCRTKGHGFIKDDLFEELIFLHVFDVEGEFVPHENDSVEYRKTLIPPKNVKFQAVHCKIVHLAPGHHETWDEPAKSN